MRVSAGLRRRNPCEIGTLSQRPVGEGSAPHRERSASALDLGPLRMGKQLVGARAPWLSYGQLRRSAGARATMKFRGVQVDITATRPLARTCSTYVGWDACRVALANSVWQCRTDCCLAD